jgi:L-lactate dehydrogenase
VSERRATRIVVIGAGHVGATFAYALLLSGLATEIVLIDRDEGRAEGEAMDLSHAVPFSRPTRIRAGTYDDCAGAAITVFAAGSGQRPGETRLELVRRNVAVLRDVVPRVAAVNPSGILLLTTNPVDVLTYDAWRVAGLPRSRVIGSGTTLDTGRFRALLGDHFAVDPRSVHAFVVGEHGDSEVPVWSGANVAGVGLAELAASSGRTFGDDEKQAIFTATRDAAYAVIERKGATYYAVAAALVRIVEAIVRDQRTVLPVSSVLDGQYGLRDVALSVPSVVGANGVEQALELALDDEEMAGLRRSAGILRETIDQLDPR